jgi:phage-related minor tail protein
VATGKVSNELLRESAQSAVLWERATGQAASKTAEQFASLKGDPLTSVLKLNEGMNFLTKSTYEQIKSLDEQGKSTAAAAVAQQAYATALTSRSSEIERNLGSIERGWIAIKDAAKGGWDAMLNVGRAETTLDRLAQVRKEIAATEAQLQGGKGFATTEGGAAVGVGAGRTNAVEQARLKSRLTSLGAEAASLEAIAYAARTAAEEERKRGEEVVATAAFDQAGLKYLTEKQKLERELAVARQQGLNAGKSQAQIEERLNLIREEYRKKAGSGSVGATELASLNARADAAEKYLLQLRTVGLEAKKLTDGERRAAELREQLKETTSDQARKEKELLLVQADRLGVAERASLIEEQRQKAIKKSADEYDKLIEATFKSADALQDQADKQEAANAVYGKGAAAIDELALATLKSRMAEAQASDSFSEKFIAALEAQIQAQERLNAARAEGRFKEMNESLDRELAAANQQAALYQDELRLTGLSALERAKIVALRQSELELARDLEKIEQSGLKDAEKEQLRITAREKQRVAGSAAVNKVIQDDFTRTSETIERSLTDALLRGFESGKGFAKNLRDTVANMFKTLVLRPVISAIVNPVAGAITGALGLAGTASAATAAASGGSILGSAGGILSGVGALAGNFGAGLTTGFSGLMAGNLGSTLGLGTGLIGSGATAGGIGTIVGALGPIALGIGALVAIGKATKGETRTGGQFGVSFDGTVTNQRRGQTYTYQGQQFDRDFSNGQRNALIAGQAYRLEGDPVAQEQAIRDAVSGTAKGINGFLEALGSSARLTGFSAGFETSIKDRGGNFAGGIFNTGATFGESGKGDNYQGTLYEKFSTNSPDFKTALENFALDLKQSTIQALQTVTDIPETVQKLLKGVDAEGLSEEAANKLLETINAQIVGVNQFKDALKGMGLDTLAALSFDAAAGLAEVSGGFDKLLGNLGTYYSNFFSPEEQRANMQRQLREQLASLNLTLPDINATDARAQYRRLVEAAEKDLSEEGRKTYATLLQLAGAFAGITTAAEDAAQALERQRSSASDLFQQALRRDRDAIGAQVSILQASIDAGRSLVDMLRGSARDLLGSVDDSRNMLAAQGMVYIERAIAGLQSGGRLADYTGLSGAVDAAVSGISGGTYRNDTERAYDAKVLAGQLNTLGNLEDLSLSIEEQQLAVLNKELDRLKGLEDQAKATVEGLTTLTGTVDFYLAELLKLFKPAAADTTTTGGSSAGGGFSFGGSSSTPSKQPGPGDKAANGNYVREQYLGGGFGSTYSAVSDGEQKLLEGLSSGLMTQFAGTGDVAGLLSAAKDAGYTLSDLATVGGYNYLDVLDKARSLGIPAFEVGTNYVPRDMLAQIHEGEAIVPKAFNPWANGYAGGVGDNAVLIAEIRALREEVAALRSAGEVTAQACDQTANVMTRVTNNGNGMINAAAPI